MFSTTERLSGHFIKTLYPDTHVPNLDIHAGMKLHAPNAHLIYTDRTRASHADEFKRYLSRLRDYLIRDTGDDIQIVADSFGASLNSATIRGMNGLAETNLIVKLSRANVVHAKVLSECLPDLTDSAVSSLISVDHLNQTLGRNNGYRATGCWTVVFADTALAKVIEEHCRYRFASIHHEADFTDRSKSITLPMGITIGITRLKTAA